MTVTMHCRLVQTLRMSGAIPLLHSIDKEDFTFTIQGEPTPVF